MIRRMAFPLAAVLAAGCAVGPGYHPESVVPTATKVGAARSSDSARAFFDSLAAARAKDTLAAGPVPIPPTSVLPDSLASLAWLDIFRDSTMVGLVRTALAQNRDLRTAVGRIREFRAEVGIAKAPLFPELSANGSVSTNQVAIGSFPPTSYDAFRVTGDVAWELDFWGRARRGVEAARADLASEAAAQRAVVLSLVSDVATGYLSLLELDQERTIAERTLTSRQATLDLARQRFKQGLTSELDVRQFEAQVAVPASTLAQTERLRAEQEHQLSLLLGEAPVTIARGGTLTRAVSALAVPDSLPATLLARRPDVQQAERAFAAATARIGVAEAARLPTISISGYYGTQVPSAGDLFTSNGEIYQALAGISIPLFTGGRLVNQTAGGPGASRSGPLAVRAERARRAARGQRRADRRPHRARPGRRAADPGARAPARAAPGRAALSDGHRQLHRGARRPAQPVRRGAGVEPGAAPAALRRGTALPRPGRELADDPGLIRPRSRARAPARPPAA